MRKHLFFVGILSASDEKSRIRTKMSRIRFTSLSDTGTRYRTLIGEHTVFLLQLLLIVTHSAGTVYRL
jgi:hypothetical protein